MTDAGKEEGRLWVWPDSRQRWRLAAALIWLSFLFALVYGGADYITSLRQLRFPIHFAFELSLPFVPGLSVVYSSVYLMFVGMALTLHSADQLRRFVWAMSWMTITAGVCFFVFPAELAFDPPDVTTWAAGPFDWADRVNLTYNCVPSLHVAYAVLCAETLRRKRWWGGLAFHLWALAIAVAAWLTYQHHLVDLVTGYAFGGVFAWSQRCSANRIRETQVADSSEFDLHPSKSDPVLSKAGADPALH